jgi:glycine cleavage system H protein
MTYPAAYKYTKTHEWLNVDGSTASVGITDYAQNSLGDIVFVELPKVGDKVEAGKLFGSVESVKAVSDLYSPVSGTVTEVNEALNPAPETINNDANGTWLFKMELSDPGELTSLDSLIDAAAYEAFVAEETGH